MKKIVLILLFSLYPILSFGNFNLFIDGNIQNYKNEPCKNEEQVISLMDKTEILSTADIVEDTRESLVSEAIGKFEIDVKDIKGKFEIKDYKLKFGEFEYPLDYYKGSFTIGEDGIYFFGLKLLCDREKIIEDRIVKNTIYENSYSGEQVPEDYPSENLFESANPESFLNKLTFSIKDSNGKDLNEATITLIDSFNNKLVYKRIGVTSPYTEVKTKTIPLFIQLNNAYKILIEKEGYENFTGTVIPNSKEFYYSALLKNKTISNIGINGSGSSPNTNSGQNITNDGSDEKENLEGDNKGDNLTFDIEGVVKVGDKVINGNITIVNKINSKIIYSLEVKNNLFLLENFESLYKGDYYYLVKDNKGKDLGNGIVNIKDATKINILLEDSIVWKFLILIIGLFLTSILLVFFKKKKIINGEDNSLNNTNDNSK